MQGDFDELRMLLRNKKEKNKKRKEEKVNKNQAHKEKSCAQLFFN
jgi:hypothetical protein